MASRNHVTGARIFDNIFFRNKQKVLVQTLGAALTVTTNFPNRMVLDPGGAARTVTLPAAAEGLNYRITNNADASELITVNNASAVAVGSVAPGETVEFFCDGTNWFTFGGAGASAGGIIPVTAATLTLTRAQHGGKTLALNRAGGIDLTLPAALGLGTVFEGIIITATTDAYTLAPVGSDKIAGQVLADDGDGEPANGFSNAGTAVLVSLGGASQATGGSVGDRFVIQDVAAALWQISIWATQGGTEATPFS